MRNKIKSKRMIIIAAILALVVLVFIVIKFTPAFKKKTKKEIKSIYRNDFKIEEFNTKLWTGSEKTAIAKSNSKISRKIKYTDKVQNLKFEIVDGRLVITNESTKVSYTVKKIVDVKTVAYVNAGKYPGRNLYIVLNNKGEVFTSRTNLKNSLTDISDPRDFERTFFKIDTKEKIVDLDVASYCIGEKSNPNSYCVNATALKGKSGKQYIIR